MSKKNQLFCFCFIKSLALIPETYDTIKNILRYALLYVNVFLLFYYVMVVFKLIKCSLFIYDVYLFLKQ